MRILIGTVMCLAAIASAAPAHAFRPRAYTNYGTYHAISQGTTQTVASVTLPIGSYTLSATVGAEMDDGSGSEGIVSCEFVSFGSVHQMQYPMYANTLALETFPVLGDVTIAADATPVYLRCKSIYHLMGVTAGMIATRVGNIVPSS